MRHGEKPSETDNPQRYFDGMVVCSGHRLLVRKEDLAEFLCVKGLDLIVDIEIRRRDQRGSGLSYDTEDSKSADFERLILLRRSGAVEAAERSYDSWRSNCS